MFRRLVCKGACFAVLSIATTGPILQRNDCQMDILRQKGSSFFSTSPFIVAQCKEFSDSPKRDPREFVANAVEKVMPSVVSIITTAGTGTGFVVAERGLIVTNHHVVRTG